MRALCWHGTGDVRVDTVPDPQIQDPGDAIVKITASGICGSDLHLVNGFMPTMEKGDIPGHEPMGEVVEVGRDVKKLKKGDRVVVPFTISCGSCSFCTKGLTMKSGETHMQRYMRPLLQKIEAGEIDPSFVITHSVKLEDAPEAYKTFRDRKDGCIKVVLKP